MKILSYNVNGIRAASGKGLLDWFKTIDYDVICLQEIKAQQEQINAIQEELEATGYHCFWYSAEKKGYSGTAILSKLKPKNVTLGCGIEDYDREGRMIRCDFEACSVISAYFPSGSSGDARQDFKMQFLADMSEYIAELRKTIPNLVLSGDYNICHEAIDIHNPVANANTSGFLPEEREWMTDFLKEQKMLDSFRYKDPNPHNYTWWSYRANARAKNLGWRIDYHLVSEELQSKIDKVIIFKEVIHSDHCPIGVILGV